MGFEALLGNEQLKENLRAARRKGRMSHFYLLSGPQGSGKHTLASLIAAAMLCDAPEGPCGVCQHCRKVLSGSHPDYITIDDPSKKTVPVDLIRQARADIFVRPNEGSKKIYLFPRAQDMGIPGQNALLKILEEPPSYGVFLLLTDNPEKLLPTVRSRCVELKLRALPENLLSLVKDANLLMLTRPNAPTGNSFDFRTIGDICSKFDGIVVIDEAYVDFGGESALKLIDKYENLLVVRTFSKSYSLAGARLGFAFGNRDLIADLDVFLLFLGFA